MKSLIIAVVLLACTSTANAQSIWKHTRNMQRSGRLFHAERSRTAEAVFQSSGRANRLAAMRSWLRSPGHRKIALSLGFTVCRGNVCTRRKLFR